MWKNIGKIMSKQSDQVAIGFMRLTVVERQEVVEKINEFINAPESNKVLLTESLRIKAGLDLGPIGQGGCRCCGK